MEPALLADYDALGSAGGGTLELEKGTYVLGETLSLQKYSNVSIQGAGIGRTIVSMPIDPVGKFTALNGTRLGRYDPTLNRPVLGTTANLIQVMGPAPIDNFEICDLTLRGEANTAAEDWSGSLLFDSSGGTHHVFTDLAESGLFGPSTEPNGIHLDAASAGTPATGYVLNRLSADNNSLPYKTDGAFHTGSNFLNIGRIEGATLENVTGEGQAAFEVAPARGCLVKNWFVRGEITIDPSTGGSWGGTLFENVTSNSTGTPASYTLTVQVSGASSGKADRFSDLSWVDDRFVGTVTWAANMVRVDDSTFVGTLNETPATLVDSTVTITRHGDLPIRIEGTPTGGSASALSGDSFTFTEGTAENNPFLLTVSTSRWSNDLVEVSGRTTGYLLSAPHLKLSNGSEFSRVTYRGLGDKAPTTVELFNLSASPGFSDAGANVSHLVNIRNDLHRDPSPAGSALALAVLEIRAARVID